ncbi:ead/Ea22-like family protein [Salmonella enterica subsp. enterica serovar Goverdhan]|nr:ead/Ea22-like family protein [Salmonella enterica subsp. enterica serovar Goverdhan]EDT8794846.1 ead/Ea22-like family protein [Salmonella enterica subsp. enterica]EKO5066079.1 ead/Ea22-like family protein [Salmonella enterica]EBU7061089.1 hypothetical protein [Salmonella enterica subsp. enterica serovar Goverdhan]ECD2895778.1 ead/Ea22-like family protein [Salmonella enterica subsp. enterica serovar Goverdhan]
MTALNKQALRQITESVDREKWEVLDNGDDEYQVIVSGSLERGASYRSYQPVANEISGQKIAAFIAAFNPVTILELLDENLQLQRDKDSLEAVAIAMRDDMRDTREKLEAAEKRIAEHNFENRLLANADRDIKALRERIAELEAKLETADRLQDSAFRDGLKAGFSYGQTDDQSGFTQCMSAYSPGAGIKVKGA